MILAIALALAAQFGNPDNADGFDDLAFMSAVEDLCRPLASSPPEPFPDLFRRMAMSDWKAREKASRDAVAHVASRPGDIRFLFWGRRHPDPEVRLRCNGVIRRASPCRSCDGNGVSRNWAAWACSDCGGRGNLWFLTAWD